MELRVLQYFLAVARCGSFTAAAEALHITQPTLSRQIRDLEEELGRPLLVRGSHSVTLTESGMLLRKRAEEILQLTEKTQRELARSDEVPAGDVYIGAGETVGVHLLTRAARRLRRRCPQVQFHIVSGDGLEVCELLDKGLVDFGLVFDHADRAKYDALTLPHRDVWGVLLRRDDPLSARPALRPEDLFGRPLLASRQVVKSTLLSDWCGPDAARLTVAGTYTLAFNASLMVEDGLGCALCLDRIVHPGDGLCFRPLEPRMEAGVHLIWKRYQVFSPAAQAYLEELRRGCGPQGGE